MTNDLIMERIEQGKCPNVGCDGTYFYENNWMDVGSVFHTLTEYECSLCGTVFEMEHRPVMVNVTDLRKLRRMG